MRPLKHQLPGSEPDRAALDRVWERLEAPTRREAWAGWPLAFAGVSAALLVAVVGWYRAANVTPPPVEAPRFAHVTLEDGTELGQAEAVVVADGVVRVDASAGPAKVKVRGLTLTAQGGRFLVRVAAETVQVEVESGEVQVVGEALTRVVRAGERLEHRPAAPPVAWLPLARAGRFAEAADLLGAPGRRQVAQAALSPEERLLFGDVAQAAGEPAVALAQWSQLSAADAGVELRALASWRRGLQLSQVPGEERAAAHAFESAAALGLPGLPAALVATRVADAWRRAGDEAGAARWLRLVGDAGTP